MGATVSMFGTLVVCESCHGQLFTIDRDDVPRAWGTPMPRTMDPQTTLACENCGDAWHGSMRRVVSTVRGA